MNEQHDPETAMERFEDFARKVFSKTKDELKKVEKRPDEIVDDALVSRRPRVPPLADDED